MNRLEEGRAIEGIFRNRDAENIYVTSIPIDKQRRLVLTLSTTTTWTRRRCFLLTVALCFLVVVVTLTAVHMVSPGDEAAPAVAVRDPFFYEPETKIISSRHPAATTNDANTNDNVVNDDFVPRAPQCPDWSTLSTTTATASSSSSARDWDMLGQEMVKGLKDEMRANAGAGAAAWSKHFGFGSDVLLSGDGRKLAVSYEGYAGFDKAFGAHIDVMVWNEKSKSWDLEQVVTAVHRHHGHDTDVRFLSMALSKDGNRLAFSDGHGVHVFQYHEHSENSNKKWQRLESMPDPSHPGQQFGTHLSFNCDGSVLAVSGTQVRNSYTQIYQQQVSASDPTQQRWMLIGEIQNKKHGGGIALNGTGDRIAVGTIASEGWKGMVQVFDYRDSEWVRTGQPVVGERSMELWGGQVALSADGTTLVASSNAGGNNRVAAYRLLSTSDKDNNATIMWHQLGESLHGTINEHEYFGADIDTNYDGTIIAIGAPGDYELFEQMQKEGTLPAEDAPFVKGRIYTYRLEFDGATGKDFEWAPMDNGELVGTTDGDLYGKSVAISASGTTVVGGAPRRTGKAFQHILGSAHVYRAVE